MREYNVYWKNGQNAQNWNSEKNISYLKNG